jgi:hypothetical protein
MTPPQAWALAGFGVSTWAAAQLWFAQLVIYPLFARVGESQNLDYHRFYARRILLPVIVPGFACFLLPWPLAWLGSAAPILASTNVGCGLLGLLVTVVLEIPRHVQLERHGRDVQVITELIRYNWPRTLAVTAQAGCCLAMLMELGR